jgi:CO/xanthine dehydrogenase FAD-binding subunit
MMTDVKRDGICILSSRHDDAQAWLSLGAQASLQAVYEATASPDLLRRSLTGVITWQKRNDTTVEKAILSPNLAPQWVGALLALGGRVAIQKEEQEEPLPDFMQREASHRGRLAGVRLPLNVAGRVWGASRVARTPADEPIVEAVAVVDLARNVVRQARLALTGVWRQPVRLTQSSDLLVGGPLNDDHIRKVAAAVEREVTPLGDFRGSAEYRRAMAGVLTRRALNECIRGSKRL